MHSECSEHPSGLRKLALLGFFLTTVALCLSGGCDALNPGPSDAEIVELIRAEMSPYMMGSFRYSSIRNAQTHEVRLESRGERDERGTFQVRAHVRMTFEVRGFDVGPWVPHDESLTLVFEVMKDRADAARWIVRRL